MKERFFGYYIIGYFDILGQSTKLAEMERLSFRHHEQAVRALNDTLGVVLEVRKLFESFFLYMNRQTAFSASLPKSFQDTIRQHSRTRWNCRWSFSDSYVVAAPIRRDIDKASASVSELRTIICIAATAWLHMLSAGHPLRGGIEVGRGVNITDTEVYGSALDRAHCLESKVAKYPRIVVGKGCLQFLRTMASNPRKLSSFGDVDAKLAADNAGECLRMLRNVEDGGHAMLDSLDRGLYRMTDIDPAASMFEKANQQASCQLKKAEAREDDKLIDRYRTLLEYFNEKRPQWGLGEFAPPA